MCGEVVRDQEQLRGGEAGRDRLARVDVALDDDAVDRRVIDVYDRFCCARWRATRADFSPACATCSAAPPCSSSLVAISPDAESSRLRAWSRDDWFACACSFSSSPARRRHPARERRVDAREELALLDVVVEVDEQRRDLPRDLRADADRGDGIERPGRRDDGLEVAPLHDDEAECGRLLRERKVADEQRRHGDSRDEAGQGDCLPVETHDGSSPAQSGEKQVACRSVRERRDVSTPVVGAAGCQGARWIRLATCATNSAGSTGFARCPSKPAARAFPPSAGPA